MQVRYGILEPFLEFLRVYATIVIIISHAKRRFRQLPQEGLVWRFNLHELGNTMRRVLENIEQLLVINHSIAIRIVHVKHELTLLLHITFTEEPP
jgi:hypothetical protein